MPDHNITLRLTLVAPPKGVLFSLCDADNARVDPMMSDGSDLSLDVTVRLGEGPDGPRWLGPFVRREGPRRFVYFTSGGYAIGSREPFSRRGKVWLDDLAPDLAIRAATAGQVVEARMAGSDKHGMPACASMKLLEPWRAVDR
jgi:hypothetical protein